MSSCELHLRSSCPQPPQPIPVPCEEGRTEICFFGKQRSYNVTGLVHFFFYLLNPETSLSKVHFITKYHPEVLNRLPMSVKFKLTSLLTLARVEQRTLCAFVTKHLYTVQVSNRTLIMSWEQPASITWAALPPTGQPSELSAKVTKLFSLLSQLTRVQKEFTQNIWSLPSAPQYVSPFLVDSNLTVIWLDWTVTFSINGYLKEFTVTESQLRVYTGFYSYLHIPRTSQKGESTTNSCITLQWTQEVFTFDMYQI